MSSPWFIFPAPTMIVRTLGLLLVGIAVTLLTARRAKAACTGFSIPAMNLGTYTGSQTIAGTVNASFTCPLGTFYSAGLSVGTGAGATVTNRVLTSGSNTLSYQLYQDATRLVNWGMTASGGANNILATGLTQTFGIYPLIAASTTAPPGTYVDTITATLIDSGITSTTFTVTVTVSANCTVAAGSLAFGTYTSSADKLATSSISVTCTNTTTYNVGLSAGTGTGAGNTTRYMTGPSTTLLLYQIYSDSNRTTLWGSSVGTNTVPGTGSGTAQNLTTYDRPSGQSVYPGFYSDTVTVTLTY